MAEQRQPIELLARQEQHLAMLALDVRDIRAQLAEAQREPRNVYIVDVNMPFMALVGLLIKIALAAIPASIIASVVVLAILGSSCVALLGQGG